MGLDVMGIIHRIDDDYKKRRRIQLAIETEDAQMLTKILNEPDVAKKRQLITHYNPLFYAFGEKLRVYYDTKELYRRIHVHRTTKDDA